ncbi:hypothetical protein PHMEG_00039762 [Phytophthora megakarya]|uniref:CCHC-type domain-containing protein n=1 Tax=Phytophthora megakarya TaxID=4795 RepID=A0A225UF67_9STRA|nr:hypothetical protein PHMEG_00039762 [Phytophthora megakarya]
MTPRIRVSAISELKEYSGKDQDEDRARSWLGKVKSAFVRDQAPNSEKCLVLGDLLTGPARNWYRQLSRSTRSNWKSLLEAFQTQYCGRGNARAVRAIQKAEDSSESESDASGSEQEDECRRVYLAESKERGIQTPTPAHQDNPDHTAMSQKNCTHCGSTKHDNLGCWKRLTCQKCGRKGHPSDHCLFVCRACGEMHDSGKCPMEEFYNLIRQWYVPNKHSGMLPANAEKMLN